MLTSCNKECPTSCLNVYYYIDSNGTLASEIKHAIEHVGISVPLVYGLTGQSNQYRREETLQFYVNNKSNLAIVCIRYLFYHAKEEWLALLTEIQY